LDASIKAGKIAPCPGLQEIEVMGLKEYGSQESRGLATTVTKKPQRIYGAGLGAFISFEFFTRAAAVSRKDVPRTASIGARARAASRAGS
jgi:hypothetical protein